MSKETALMVIDVQVGMYMFPEEYPVFEGEQLLERINLLLAKARENETPVIFVQHNEDEEGPLATRSPGWEIHPALVQAAGDLIVQKFEPDAFHETNLQQELEARGIKKLVLTGMQTDYCVNATCWRAVDLGYEVTVVADAHSTFGQGGRTAEQIIAEHNEAFGQIAVLKETAALEF
ncbi:cysteine hydrolase family protein [Paenibacillus glycanilyticus]|uniref:Isochorismatase n=1 Tax=Paenibacillus glycanilyticus TaxID=126569 RepID=A0ABQ6GJ04_9BACL|nr:cysteine hydrolase family protein [Paenibacillus glycanilyticus]GLX70470.1 isochorismatase [Paenibacillus glycanilyticus]